MASKIFGTVKAPIKQIDGKTKYMAIGRAMKDETGRISMYIEALPRDMANWTGWLNIYEDDAATAPVAKKLKPHWEEFDDDIPF